MLVLDGSSSETETQTRWRFTIRRRAGAAVPKQSLPDMVIIFELLRGQGDAPVLFVGMNLGFCSAIRGGTCELDNEKRERSGGTRMNKDPGRHGKPSPP